MKGLLAFLSLAAMAENNFGTNIGLSEKDIDFTIKTPPIPNGCKEYFFNSLGDFINYNDGVYHFKCVAMSDKSAIKKFEKWRNKQFKKEFVS